MMRLAAVIVGTLANVAVLADDIRNILHVNVHLDRRATAGSIRAHRNCNGGCHYWCGGMAAGPLLERSRVPRHVLAWFEHNRRWMWLPLASSAIGPIHIRQTITTIDRSRLERRHRNHQPFVLRGGHPQDMFFVILIRKGLQEGQSRAGSTNVGLVEEHLRHRDASTKVQQILAPLRELGQIDEVVVVVSFHTKCVLDVRRLSTPAHCEYDDAAHDAVGLFLATYAASESLVAEFLFTVIVAVVVVVPAANGVCV